MIRGTVHWVPGDRSGRLFVGETVSGRSVLFDEPDTGVAPSPMETVALALASCTGFDVVKILRKKRQRVARYDVHVDAEQAVGPPAVFTAIRVHHRVWGDDVDPAAVQQAIDLSHTKYCSVGVMLEQSATVRHTFEVIEERPVALPQAGRDGAAAA